MVGRYVEFFKEIKGEVMKIPSYIKKSHLKKCLDEILNEIGKNLDENREVYQKGFMACENCGYKVLNQLNRKSLAVIETKILTLIDFDEDYKIKEKD